jgi:hypothetical protein
LRRFAAAATVIPAESWRSCSPRSGLQTLANDAVSFVFSVGHGSSAQVALALAYRDSYPDEIAEAIGENRRTPEQWRELYPSLRLAS